jgi:thioredoxin 1
MSKSLHFLEMAEQPENVRVYEGDLDGLYKAISDRPGLVVVEFASTTCMPCRRVRQLIPGFAQENPSVFFLIVEVDQHPELGQPFSISSVPNVKFFKGQTAGKPTEVDCVVGANIPDIKAKIAQYAA